MSAANGHVPLEGALHLAALGLRVHPLRGKRDAAEGTRAQASSDPAEVRRLFLAHPEATNVGVVPGPHYIGLDIDVRSGGWERVAILEDDAAADLPRDTLSWQTGGAADELGRRGAHLLYRVSSPVRSFTLAPGVEVKGLDANLAAPPSVHPDTGDPYGFLVDDEALDAPAWLLDLVPERREQPECGERRDAAFDTPYGLAALGGEQGRIRAMPEGGDGRKEGRNRQLRDSAYALGRLVGGGELTYDTARDGLASAALGAGYRQEGTGGLYRPHRTTITRGLADGMQAPRNASVRGAQTSDDPPHDGTPPPLGACLAAYSAHLALDDDAHVLCALAAAATRNLDGEPLWLLLVGSPSSSKTETLRSLNRAVDARLDDFTAAGLLSWVKRGKQKVPGGVLSRHPGDVLLTIADLSTLLANSERGQRDQLYAILRRVYDGHVSRESNDGRLEWSGRATVIGAATPQIDNLRSHDTALGARWVYVRLPELAEDTRRRGSRLVRTANQEQREELLDLANEVVASATARIDSIFVSDDLADAIDDAADVAARCRGAVPRGSSWKREVIGAAIAEEPFRLVAALSVLARGLLAIGLDEKRTAELCRRVAMDSIPVDRRLVLRELAGGEAVPAGTIARRTGLHRHVAGFALDDLLALGVTTYASAGSDEEDDGSKTPKPWRLDGPHAVLVARVVIDDEVARNVGRPPPDPPKDGGGGGGATHTSCHPGGQS